MSKKMENSDKHLEIKRRLEKAQENKYANKKSEKKLMQLEEDIYLLRRKSQQVYEELAQSFAETDLYPYIIAAEEENRSDFVKQIESIDKAKENNLLELKKLYEEEEECGNQLRQMREE